MNLSTETSQPSFGSHPAGFPFHRDQIRCFPLPQDMTGQRANFWLSDFLTAFRREPSHCVLVMAGTNVLDAHGFRMLLAAVEEVRRDGFRIVLVEPHPRVREMIKDLCLHQEISIFSYLGSAICSLSAA